MTSLRILTEEPQQSEFGSAFREHDRRASENTTKVGSHAHDRMRERTPFHEGHVDILQRAVDTLSLDKGAYHLPLRSKDGVLVGYAQFRGVTNRKAPVLTTVLKPSMTPSGTNIEHLLKTGEFREKDPHEDERPPQVDKPSRQETLSSTLRRAFGNLTQSTGLAMENGK